MGIELTTDSHLGKYDRNTTVVITKIDGTQMFASRSTRHGAHKLSPLSWWRECGFVKEDQEQWSKCVHTPEYARLLKAAGITPADLLYTRIPEPYFGSVLEWFNAFRAVTPEYKSLTLDFFKKFLSPVNEITRTNRTRNPFNVAEFVRKTGIIKASEFDLSRFTFLIGQNEWIDECANLPRHFYTMPDTIKMMMQLGMTPEILSVLSKPVSGAPVSLRVPPVFAISSALSNMFRSGELNASTESYEDVRRLADISSVLISNEAERLFFSEGVNRKRLHGLVVTEGIRDMAQLEAIILNDTPVVLAIGAL